MEVVPVGPREVGQFTGRGRRGYTMAMLINHRYHAVSHPVDLFRSRLLRFIDVTASYVTLFRHSSQGAMGPYFKSSLCLTWN